MLKHEFNLPCCAYEEDYLFIHIYEGRKQTIDIGVSENNETTRIAINEESLKNLINHLQEVYSEVYGE